MSCVGSCFGFAHIRKLLLATGCVVVFTSVSLAQDDFLLPQADQIRIEMMSESSPAIPIKSRFQAGSPLPLTELQRNQKPLQIRNQNKKRKGFGTPKNDPAAQLKASRYVIDRVDPELTLDVQIGQPAILVFKQPPLRDQVADTEIIDALNLSDREISITGKVNGTTVYNLWFENPEVPGGREVISYLVRVFEDPEAVHRDEIILAKIEKDVNRAFPDSAVRLSYVGSQVVVRGQAKDINDATQILRVVTQSIPKRDDDEETGPDYRLDSLYLDDLDSNTLTDSGGLQSLLQGNNASGANATRLNNRVVNMLEIAGVHQVMLKVTIAEVNRSAIRRASANLILLFGDSGAFTSFGSLMRLAEGAFEDVGGTGGSIIVDRGDFDLIMNFLKSNKLARALAEPTLTTLNGQIANFQVGGSFPVPDNGLAGGNTGGVNFVGGQSVRFVPFGVQLNFTPTVTDHDRIRLQLSTSVSTRDESTGATIGDTDVSGLTERQFNTVVELREGQTLAFAGLIQNNLGGESDGTPFLSDIPYLGRLFSQDNTSYDEQELIVLVTPYLVDGLDESCTPLPLPGSDYFEPDDIEYFLRGSLTGRFAEDYRTPIRTDLCKMKAFRRLEQEFIIGQPGHSNGLFIPDNSYPANP